LGTPRTGFSAGNELNLWDSTGSLGQNRQLENVKKPGKSQRVVLDHPSDSEGNECFCPDFTPLWDGCDTGLPLLTTDNNALPGGQVEGFAFDLGGNLVYQTNYNGMVITNQYDELNRLTNQISVNGYQVSYAYDPATGQRVRMTDGSGVTAYGYDRRDRLVLKTVNWNQGPGVSLNYGYDADGNVTNLWSGTAGGFDREPRVCG
jgi:YD repeat-containing protein